MMERTSLDGALRSAYATPWAIEQTKLVGILELLALRGAGVTVPHAQAPQHVGMTGKVAILPLYGVMTQRLTWLSAFCGGTSTDQFAAVFDAVLANPDVKAVVIDVDSPGGSVAGTAELAQRIYEARGQGKRIIGIANSLAASAAYWVASACSELWASPTALCGSIGVFALHEDLSKAADAAGVKVTLISAGKYKTEGSPYEPLGAEAQAAMQRQVNQFYDLFVKAVAKQRAVPVDRVRNGFGQGRVVGADDALAEGMISRIGTLEDVLVSLRAVPGPNARSRAQLEQRLREREIGFDGASRSLEDWEIPL